MNLNQFLTELSNLGVKLWTDGDQLRVRAPKGVLTQKQRDLLTLHKTELVTLLRSSNMSASDIDLPLVRVGKHLDLPVSFAQQSMLFLDRLDRESSVYIVSFSIRIIGSLSVTALEQSINEIIRRHEAIRTTFLMVEGVPMQAIAPKLTITLPVVDLQGLLETEVQLLIIKSVRQPFNLEKDPLLRVSLLRLEPESHLLILTIHHIIMDGWSMGIFLKELGSLYPAFTAGEPSPLPELTIQYADFAIWQRQWLTGEVVEKQLNYWKQQLADAPPLLELPTDYPRPPVQTFCGASREFQLDPHLTKQLVALSQKSDVTLFMTLLAAFAILLHRYSSQDDICIGSPFANRSRHEVSPLIGFFVNSLVLRTQIEGNPTFSEFLFHVRSVVLDAHAHQDVPFEQVVKALQPERSTSYNPLFQVMFVLENFSLSTLELPGISLTPELVERGIAKFDLSLVIWETKQGLIGSWEYNSDLFEPDTIARMALHFQTLLEAIVEAPDQRVGELPLLTESERYQLLVEWNNTTKEYPFDKCIHQLFEEQVRKTPHSVAVVYEDEQLTYQELNERANQLAHYLQALGVRPEVLVGICVERSLEMIVGLLGILKAGGAYMPLDPAYPCERLAFMLSDAQIPVVLTQERLLDELPSYGAQVVCLDSNWQDIAQGSQENPRSGVAAENLAYVIYTSGSTGKPKGVMINHRNVLALLHGFEQVATRVEPLISTFVCPYSFDLSVWEIFSNLCFGGTLHILLPEIFADPESFASYLINHHVTTTYIPPALLSDVAPELEKQSNSITLNRILVGVEPIKQGILQRFLHVSPAIRIVNGYGPTETTICATFYNFCGVTDEDRRTPIGTAVQNYIVYIFDHHLQPVPIGVPGELYIGGAGLARGYLNRPDLTQEKFIAHPLSNELGVRLYKTGDLARYLPDGNIEFLGRIDNQVKIRGFRIEVGEIEAAIAQYPGVRETVVVAREDVPDRKYLAAYIVPNNSSAIVSSDLRGFLKEKLPDYMIPGAFVMLDVLPLTPNGKVDRRALPAPEFQPELQRSLVAPRTPIEEMLASIWADVLSIELVGVHHNFFELGGHSLLATQVISRVRDTFAVELPLRSLFEAPTIAEFASRVENSLSNGQLQEALPLLPIPRSESIPLSFAQARLWFLDQLQPNSAFYNIPLALRLSGQLNIAALQSSINEIIRRHEALRTNFTTQEGQPVAVIAATVNCQLQVVNLLHIRESSREIEAQRLARVEANRPFNLEQESLLRGMVLQLGETKYVLLFTMHHIISDGWSLGVFTRELTELYKAFCTGITPVLPSLPVQYADFALWQRQWLPGEILEAQLDYWKQQLNDAPALLEVPTDRPRPAVQTYRGRYHYAALSPELSGKLSALSKLTGVTLFMTLLAAFVTLLCRTTSSDDIVVGTPVAGRNRRGIERLIGFFVNTLVLRTHLGNDPSFEDALSRVREVALGAYTHQDLPFEQLVEALQPQRDLSYTPLIQVMFALDEKSVPSFELPELMVSEYAVEIGTAKFDLTLSMENTADGLVGVWEYNVDLFDETTIARMARHFQTLLEGIVANPQARVSELPLLSEAERYQLLVEWNNTTKEYPQDKCIHQLFEEQVTRSPDAIAVILEGEQLTYRELNQRANITAHYLRTLGVGPEVLVGICIERSPLMVVGLLGILKAGGAYVPLDPAYPAERLAYMLSDSQVKVLLTQEKLASSLPVSAARVICLDSDWQNIGAHNQENTLTELKASNLAYVIYTSGSTGKPKGVTIEHRSIVNFTSSARAICNITHKDRVLQFASIAFDAAAEEIFPCLSAGATLVLRTDEMLVSGRRFVQQCREWEVTMISWPTSHWHQMMVELAAAEQTLPESLRVVILGGEAALPETLKLWQRCVKGLVNPPQLLNSYGPTEATVVATYYELSEFIAKNPAASCVPIGTPIGNVSTYILNHYLQPVPIGVPGELHIGGLGLARGYLGRPDLTAEKFIPNPFSNENEARLYKTGDLVRYLSDGNIEFLGRIDNQVKIRGFRIELGEIEAVLTQHPEVDQAVVIVHEDQPGNKRLVAYVVLKGALNSKEDLTQKIKAYLRQKLPEYMVPATLMILSVLPLTPNGKVDRRALPPPDPIVRSLALEMPQTKVEKLIADLWQKVLLLEKVGLDDNFFDMGGTSLRLVQVREELQIIFTKNISMVEMFQHPTVRTLGELLSKQESQTPDAPKSEAERAELRSSSQGDMNQRRNIRQKYRSQKKQ